MKVIRTYPINSNIVYQFPSTDKPWTVQFSNNVKEITFVGQNNSGDTNSQITEARQFNSNLTSLNDYCFNDCDNIQEVFLSPQIKQIKDRCFNNCDSVKTISYDIYETCAANESGAAPQLDHIGKYAFAQCRNMKSITLPESINNISKLDSLAFADSSLTSVTFLGITSGQLLGS